MTTPEKPSRSRFKARFVWLWHPHFWLTAVIVAILVILFVSLAN